ncbi:pantoate--beta-alanine ligase [Pseudomonas aeruginosa]|uniref:pantoate--beta-alanine ligase n=1 Tax=Pseudomonas aeruginosa TaxID=287 RepID=UPI0022357F74|nr:pantoate--beta-alanine ligase [Pseudomonas aeruginosa]
MRLGGVYETRGDSPILYACLQKMAGAIQDKKLVDDLHLQTCRQRITDAGFQLEYLEVRNAQDLSPATSIDTHLVILVAARIGKTRLIDNLTVDI